MVADDSRHPPNPLPVPTLFTAGLMGEDRAHAAWQMVRRDFLDNPIPEPLRTSLLCASLERHGGLGSGIHVTGLSMLTQGEVLLDLSAGWHEMLQQPDQRRLLHATLELGRGRELPAAVLSQVLNGLGPLAGSWQDLVAFAAWCDAQYRVRAPMVTAYPDPRLESWLHNVVVAGRVWHDVRGSGTNRRSRARSD